MSNRDAPLTGDSRTNKVTAAEVILRSLREHGVEYVFGNFGTDHTPILEAAARVRERDPALIPDFVVCPHESVALSAAHGYAATTGEPQAVIVHVDVGTQNLGAMAHNAHRGDAPVFILAGLAPVSHSGHAGSRRTPVHFLQDVYDQTGILREFCRWTGEFRPPADPDELVARALELAASPQRGPTYLTATREALETPIETALGSRRVEPVGPTAADGETVEWIATAVRGAESPIVVTSKLGLHGDDESVDALVEFAETAGAGVVEAFPAALCFPRTHELHAGFDATATFDDADLIVLADTDVPWMPGRETAPDPDVPVIQIESDPTKETYPQWDLRVDDAVRADPGATLAAVAERLDPTEGKRGRETWRSRNDARREDRAAAVERHREGDRLTPVRLTDAINSIVDDSTVVVNETTTNFSTVLSHLDLDRPQRYVASHGSGLGWAPGAAIGIKMVRPDARVLSLVGDGSYVFGQPTASAWVAGAYDVPTLTIVYNNGGWNAVRRSTAREHPDGSSTSVDVPESEFVPQMDLSHAADVVDAHTEIVESSNRLGSALEAACQAVDDGIPAVLDMRIEPM